MCFDIIRYIRYISNLRGILKLENAITDVTSCKKYFRCELVLAFNFTSKKGGVASKLAMKMRFRVAKELLWDADYLHKCYLHKNCKFCCNTLT